MEAIIPAEQKTVKKNKTSNGETKRRERKRKDRKENWTRQRRTVTDVESESCATPSKLLKIYHGQQNKTQC